MDHVTRNAMQQIISQFKDWVKSLAQESAELCTPADTAAFERRFRDKGLQMIGSIFESLLQNALNHQEENRTCPKCGRRRRHKGRRQRGLLSSVGAIRLHGTYWYCPDCGGQHVVDSLAPESSSRPMQQLLCLLGTSMASFAKASFIGKKLLGIRVSDATIRRLCYEQGREVPISPVPMETETDLLGSCDGTMVNTRQSGWKELKAYQFRHGTNKHGRAYLEPSSRFVPRLRQAAIAIRAGEAKRIFWVSDAAEWIDKGSCPWPSALSISGTLGNTFMRLREGYILIMKTRLTNGLNVIVKFLRILAEKYYGIGYSMPAMQNKIVRRLLKNCGDTYTKMQTAWRIPGTKAKVIRFPVVRWRASANSLASV